ncbi:MAG: type IV toxin-antitoxin system AbiEi family antitoxin [Thermomicrobiales bacterium]
MHVAEIYPLLRQMRQRGELKPIPGVTYVYQVVVPYATVRPVQEDEILMEVHPYAALAYLSALAFHHLTNELPQSIYALLPADGIGGMLPLGTDERDWKELALIPGRRVPKLLGHHVQWSRVGADKFHGVALYRPNGVPIRVTTPERTLLDGLQRPELSGGIENVLRAWDLARDMLDLDALVREVDQFAVQVLRQRVGYILEELGLTHPALSTWQRSAQRGGSSKLFGPAPYAPTYSERWSLSLNAPVDILHESRA